MNNLCKPSTQGRTYPLRWRVIGYQTGICGFKGDELMEQHIVFSIGDYGRIIDVIQPVMMGNFRA
jgi:hypothetical protein